VPSTVTLVLVNWNGRALLERFLPSVLQTEYPFRLHIVDNASTDGSVDWLRHHAPTARLTVLPTNTGFVGGNNAALRQLDTDYAVLLNTDVRVEPGWLEPLVRWMDTHPACAAAQPKVLSEADPGRFDYAGAAGGHIDALGYPFARGRLFDTLERDEGQYDTPAEIFWASGAALMLRASALRQVGLFDERFFMHMEEIDLCWRLRAAGHTVWAVPQSRVFHLGGGSLASTDARKTFYNVRNNLLMLSKGLPRARFVRLLAQRAPLDAAAAAAFAAQGQLAHAAAIARGYAAAHRMRGASGDARHERAFPSYGGRILWEYYARQTRHFSDLNPDAFSAAGPLT
jgi:GT2 family glycosyltransferase